MISKKKILPAVGLMLTTALSFAQMPGNFNLIPKPQKIIAGEGLFKITDLTYIITDGDKKEISFGAAYLKEKIDHAAQTDMSIKPAIMNGKNPVVSEDTTTGYKYNFIKLRITKKEKGATNPLSYDEGYSLYVSPDSTIIDACSSKGLFYGIQTLMQLLPPSIYGNPSGFEKWQIPAVKIEDYPRFSYRGFMLDVSRNFFGPEVIKNYIDWLSYHKINKFHLHLTDDNGWRIEIKKYPVLTRKGAWRGPDENISPAFGSGLKRYGGFYTQKEMKAIIRYAEKRNIEIIPEIDLPGHSKALTSCFPELLCKKEGKFESVQGESDNVLCVGNEKTYKILNNIIKEIAHLFPSKYILIGGDEVNTDNWNACSKCRALMKKEGMKNAGELLNYFVRRMNAIVKQYGKQMGGWDEIINAGEIDKNSVVYAWHSIKTAQKSLNEGYPTVMQVGEYCYLDMKQSKNERGHTWAGIIPLEKIYSFDPCGFDIPENKQRLILGPQAGLWSELLSKPRFDEYQAFPRLCALAEVGWSGQSQRNFDDFARRLYRSHLMRLYYMGIAFRMAPPEITYTPDANGAYTCGHLTITPPYPGAVVRFTCNGSEPECNSEIAPRDIYTDHPEDYRFASFFGEYIRSITTGAANILLHKYIKPLTCIKTSMNPLKNHSSESIADYDFSTYFRAEAKRGDYVAYVFNNPVECRKITITAGMPDNDFYGLCNGYAEISYDGKNYTSRTYFENNRVILFPAKPAEKIKITIIEPDGKTFCLQDLKIE
ncbi:MAG: beta-N-acetylhexosaminidase [Bacteroidales bacterium]|jgi:hexosaminidase|nr:beta-N-acetylhexosaminidase [Bacteroidales bacterium]